jgi:hypothetical protein
MRFALVLFALLFVYSSAAAEPKKLMITIECDSDPSKLLDLAQGPQYQEIPFAGAKAILKPSAMNGQAVPVELLLTVNPDTRSFSILALFADNHACLVVPGGSFAPYAKPTPSIEQ